MTISTVAIVLGSVFTFYGVAIKTFDYIAKRNYQINEMSIQLAPLRVQAWQKLRDIFRDFANELHNKENHYGAQIWSDICEWQIQYRYLFDEDFHKLLEELKESARLHPKHYINWINKDKKNSTETAKEALKYYEEFCEKFGIIGEYINKNYFKGNF